MFTDINSFFGNIVDILAAHIKKNMISLHVCALSKTVSKLNKK